MLYEMFHQVVTAFDWSNLLILVVVPIVQQILKLLSEKGGFVLSKWQNQLLALILSIGFGFVNGDFFGLGLPVWTGDLMNFIGQIVALIGGAWVLVSGIYETLWDRLFGLASRVKGLRLVTSDKMK